MRIKLIVEEQGREVALELDPKEPVSIGRGLENQVPIRDEKASRHHCRIVATPKGIFAEDLGSKNGTLLNGKQLKTYALNLGDCIAIGETKIWFGERREAPAAAPEGAAAPAAAKAPAKASGRTSARTARAAAGAGPAAPSGETVPIPAPAGTTPAPRGRFTLEGVEGEVKGKTFEIHRFPFKFGRTKKNALILHDPGVSGEHGQIEPRGDEGCVLVDLGSTNGTKVNGGKVKRAILADGARIQLGDAVLVFRDKAGKPGAGAPTDDRFVRVPPSRKGLTAEERASLDDDVVGATSAGGAAGGAGAGAEAGAKPEVIDPGEDDDEDDDLAAVPVKRTVRRPAFADEPAVDELAGEVEDGETDDQDEAEGEDEDEDEAEPGARAGAAVATGSAAAAPPLDPADSGEISAAAREAGERSGRAGLLVGIGVIAVLVGLGGYFGVRLIRRDAPEALGDPAPSGNPVANWSFEDGPADAAAVAGWPAPKGTPVALDTEAKAGGERSLRIAVPAKGYVEVPNEKTIPVVPGREIVVRGRARAQGTAEAGLGVLFGLSTDPGFRVLRLAGFSSAHDAGGPLGEVKGTVRVPAGADRARVVLIAQGGAKGGEAWFDRIQAIDRAPGPREGTPVEGGDGLSAALESRGVVVIERDGRRVVDRVALAAWPLDALARQESAVKFTLDPKSSVPRRRLLGSVEMVASTGEVVAAFTDVQAAENGLTLRYAGASRRALLLYRDSRERAGPVEVGGKPVTLPFKADPVGEWASGAGADRVGFRFEEPCVVEGRPFGRGVLFTVYAVRESSPELAIAIATRTSIELEAAAALIGAAEAKAKAGALEEARRLYARVPLEFPRDEEAKRRAASAERAIVSRGEAGVAEAAAIVEDIRVLAHPALVDAALERCRTLLQSFAGNDGIVRRAQDLLREVEAQRVRLVDATRAEAAEQLFRKGMAHLEARPPRFRLAELYLAAVAERYPETSRAKDAREKVAYARSQVEGALGKEAPR